MVIAQHYLECINGYSFKFFTLALIEEGGIWSVARNHGAIGAPTGWSFKVKGVSEAKARSAYASLLREKLRPRPPVGSYQEVAKLPGYLVYR
jgi:hypothetical protein